MTTEPLHRSGDDDDLADRFVHGLLDDAEAARLEERRTLDPAFRAACDRAAGRLAALRSVPAAEASEDLVRHTLRHVEEGTVRRSGRVRRFLAVLTTTAVAAAVLIGAFHMHYAKLEASPFDVQVLGQEKFLSGSRGAVRVAVFDRRAGAAAAGIPVRLVLAPKNAAGAPRDLCAVVTDAQGTADVSFDLPEDAGEYDLKIVADLPGGEESLVRPVKVSREWQVLTTTDKPVYQPGQTIRIRSLSLARPNLRPVAGETVEFTVADPKGNVVLRQKDVTSRFGLASVDCPLATEIVEGAWTVTARVGNVDSAVAVDVRRYVLPKFGVALSLDKPYYAPGAKLSGTVQADYFFGQPVRDAEVQIAIATRDAVTQVLDTQTLRTDAAGKATFEFVLPEHFVGREQFAGDAPLEIAADVTDSAGQRQSALAKRNVTAQPIRIEVVPESGTLVRGVANRIAIFTTHADGRPARTTIRVAGEKDELRTSALGLAHLELTPHSDMVALTLRATDVADPSLVVRHRVELHVGGANHDFVLRTDKSVYRGGESVDVLALGAGVEPVFLDLLRDGQTVLTRTVEVKDGRGELRFDLPAELTGTLQLCAYRYARSGLPAMQLRTLVVEPAGQLAVSAELDRTEYRPGTQAKIRLKLADDAGRPTVGAISLAAVDEAVFHVLKQRPGLERTFFELERKLLEPVYAVYDWSPSAPLPADVPLADRVAFEQALFARTVQRVMQPGLPGWDAATQPPGPQVGGGMPGMPGGMIAMEPMVDAVEMAPVEMAGGPAPTAPAETPFTLTASSYPQKLADVATRRADGLHGARIAWFWFAGLTFGIAAAGFAVFRPRAFLITSAVLGTLVLLPGGVLFAFVYWTGAAMRVEPTAALDEMAVGEAAPMMAFGGLGGGGGFAGGFPPMAEALAADGVDGATATTGAAEAAPPRVRQWFPETLLWRPEVVTDERGEATIEVDLADSITTWRVSGSAVTTAGRLGTLDAKVRVFQPFFVDLDLPVTLVREDEATVPVVVYNYLDAPQTVTLSLEPDEWYELVDADAEADGNGQRGPQRNVQLGPREVKSVGFRLKAKTVGRHRLEVSARAGEVADAVRREIEVDPNGRRVETVANGSLSEPVEIATVVPAEAVPGSAKTFVRLYPSTFSQLLEGLDGIFQQPYGCFEQTSSTTYPNVLALRYLRETGKSVPEVEAKARQYIHLGKQRLVAFEVPGGGFDWFGNPPANVTLTAYGLLEFEDMARVVDVDALLRTRTRQWLLSKRRPDGSWAAERNMLNDGLAGSVQRGGDLDLSTTAYVAWAVFRDGAAKESREATLDYLLSHAPQKIAGPYVLALTIEAVAALDRDEPSLKQYVDRLAGQAKRSEDGKLVWWELGREQSTNFYGAGDSGDVEATALAALALMETGSHPALVRGALAWLISKRQSGGTWPSTQATVLALQALISGTKAAAGAEKPRRIEIAVDGKLVRTVEIPVDQADVVQLVDVSDLVASGTHAIRLHETTDTGTGYQVASRYHLPQEAGLPAERPEALQVTLAYDRAKLAVDDVLSVRATVTNRQSAPAPMVVLDLPVPAGFRLDPASFAALVEGGQIAKFQITARSAIVYLRGLPGEGTLELSYDLKATMPVRLTVPAATAYEYYDRSKSGRSRETALEVTGPRF